MNLIIKTITLRTDDGDQFIINMKDIKHFFFSISNKNYITSIKNNLCECYNIISGHLLIKDFRNIKSSIFNKNITAKNFNYSKHIIKEIAINNNICFIIDEKSEQEFTSQKEFNNLHFYLREPLNKI